MTQHPELFTALAAPFAAREVKQRTQAGRQMSYVTARTVMNRLDEVLGPENWWDDYTPMTSSVICRMTIRLPDGQLLTKVDAGGGAGLADEGDDEKSAFSDAFKRTAVKFGVSRYLYRDGVATLTSSSPATAEALAPAPPSTPPKPAVRAGSEDCQGRGGRAVYGQTVTRAPSRPRTGEDLHYYAAENRDDPRLRTWIENSFAAQGYPAKILDWTPAQVSEAWPSIREHLVTVRSRAKLAASA